VTSGTTLDLVGGATLTSSSPTFTTDHSGASQGAILIVGATSFQSAPSGVYFTGSSFSVLLWLMFTSCASGSRFFDFGESSNSNSNVMIGYDTSCKLYMGVNNSTGTSLSPWLSSDNLQLNTWTHVAITFSALTNMSSMYVNGVFKSSVLCNRPPNVVRPTNYFGRVAQSTGWTSANGTALDEIKLFNKTLTAQEVIYDMTYNHNNIVLV
jgi:hypothetical protein